MTIMLWLCHDSVVNIIKHKVTKLNEWSPLLSIIVAAHFAKLKVSFRQLHL